MRLIDADALIKELEREVDLADDWKTAHEIANVVKHFPTIEPEQLDELDFVQSHERIPVKLEPERKKGKWINEGVYGEGHSQCSIRCSNPLCNFHYIGYIDDYDFCPNCGADMRGTE